MYWSGRNHDDDAQTPRHVRLRHPVVLRFSVHFNNWRWRLATREALRCRLFGFNLASLVHDCGPQHIEQLGSESGDVYQLAGQPSDGRNHEL